MYRTSEVWHKTEYDGKHYAVLIKGGRVYNSEPFESAKDAAFFVYCANWKG